MKSLNKKELLEIGAQYVFASLSFLTLSHYLSLLPPFIIHSLSLSLTHKNSVSFSLSYCVSHTYSFSHTSCLSLPQSVTYCISLIINVMEVLIFNVMALRRY